MRSVISSLVRRQLGLATTLVLASGCAEPPARRPEPRKIQWYEHAAWHEAATVAIDAIKAAYEDALRLQRASAPTGSEAAVGIEDLLRRAFPNGVPTKSSDPEHVSFVWIETDKVLLVVVRGHSARLIERVKVVKGTLLVHAFGPSGEVVVPSAEGATVVDR